MAQTKDLEEVRLLDHSALGFDKHPLERQERRAGGEARVKMLMVLEKRLWVLPHLGGKAGGEDLNSIEPGGI